MKTIRLLLTITLLFPALAMADAPDLKNGEKIFKKKCKGCHRLTEGDKMGPSLQGLTERRTNEWLDKWLQDPKGMIESGDPVAVELLKKYKKKMPKVKAMEDPKNRQDMIGFLKQY